MATDDDFDDLVQAGCELFTQYRFTESISAFNRALEMNSNDAEALNNKGYVLMKLGEYGDAMTFFDKAVKAEKGFKPALENLKKVRARLMLDPVPDNGLSFMERMGKIEKFYKKGIRAFERHQFKKALSAFDELLKFSPYDEEAWNDRGLSLGKLGRIREAVQSFERAVALNPEYEVAISNRRLYTDKPIK